MTESIGNEALTKDLYDVMGNGASYPVLSPFDLNATDPATFWVSEKWEWLGNFCDIHERYRGFRVDFTPSTEEGLDDGTAIGQTALIEVPHQLVVKHSSGRNYARLNHEVFNVANGAYATLMHNAVHVGAVPHETPLRWQKVHGLSPSGGLGGELGRYVMARFDDGRHLTIDQDQGIQFGRPVRRWNITSATPLDDGSGNTEEVKILETNARPSIYVAFMNPENMCVGSRDSTTQDHVNMIALMQEAVDVLPDRQREFLQGLVADKS